MRMQLTELDLQQTHQVLKKYFARRVDIESDADYCPLSISASKLLPHCTFSSSLHNLSPEHEQLHIKKVSSRCTCNPHQVLCDRQLAFIMLLYIYVFILATFREQKKLTKVRLLSTFI